MLGILPFVPIVILGAVAVWMGNRSPKTTGIIALAFAAIFLVSLLVDPNPRGRYGEAFFLVLAIAFGLKRLGVLQGSKSNP
jgi:hypothetical protein